MATFKVRKTWGLTRSIAFAGIAIAAMTLSVGAGVAQEPSASPAQTRESLRRAIEFHKNHEYEKAASFFAVAQAGQASLSTTDKQDLATFGPQNANALKSRQDGTAQLKQADDAVKQGRLQDASQIVQTLNANQYLTDKEKRDVAEISKRLKTQGPGSQAAKADAKSLLTAGRAALQAGDLAQAEALATQADKAASGLAPWLRPWDDTPAKLRRDIQSAKTKKDQPTGPIVKADTDAKGSSWMPSMNWFGKTEKAPAPPDAKNPEPNPTPKPPESSTTSKFLGLLPFGGGSSKDQASDRRVDEMMARQMVKDGFFFLEQANEPDKARMLATKAKELNVSWNPGEKTPDLLLHEIQRRAGGAPVETPVAKQPAETPKTTTPTSNDPRVLLKQGRTLLAQRKYEEADKVCGQALAANGRWGLWEDTPEKLRRDIQRVRQASDRDESVKLMVDARKLFTAGNIDDAEKKAYRAQQLHGPYGVFDFGDRPNKLLDEIKTAKVAQGKTTPNEKPKEIAKDKPLPTIPAGVAQANKNRAIVMVREARDLERQNLLAEAKTKAIEARGLKAVFTPDEDSPENVLMGLAGKCEKIVQQHLQQAGEAMANTADPQRMAKVVAHLTEARKLSQAFELDMARIEQATQYFSQVAAGTRPLQTVGGVFPVGTDPLGGNAKGDEPTGDPQKDKLRKAARERLEYARREMSAGKFDQARKMCEELFDAKYGIQDDVQRLVRSISAEEYNQRATEAKRNFDAGFDAVVKKDYVRAMEIFRYIDPLLLPDQHQVRLRDIMSMREMQPGVALAGHEKYNLRPTPIEVKKGGPEPTTNPNKEENPLDDFNVKMALQYQQLRVRGQETLRTAHDIFKSAKTDEQRNQAIKTLDQYIDQVNLAQLDSAKSNELRRMPEQKIQQFRTQLAESKLKGAEDSARFPMKHNEGERQRKIVEQQQQVAAKMKEAGELLKQNKNKEAAAIARSVLEIDRENVAALAMVSIATTRQNQQDYDSQVHANEGIFLKNLQPGIGPVPTMENPVAFDREMINRRPKNSSGAIQHELKDPKERAIEYRLRQPISLNLRDVPLRDAIETLKAQSGVQVVPDMRALQEARINLDAPLSISVENIDMKFALNIMLKPLNCSYIIEDQVLKITTENRTTGRLVRVTYPIADLIVAVEDHPLPDTFNIQKALERSMQQQQYFPGMMSPSAYPMGAPTPVSSHDGKGLGSAFGSQGQGTPSSPPVKDRSKDAMAALLKDLIVNTVAKDKWEEMGGTGSIQYFPMGLALVINQAQEVQEEVQLLLATLRRLQDLQVTVELRAVLVSETFFERIGVDFDMNIQTPISRTEPNLLQNTFVTAPFVNRFGRGLNMVSGLTSAGTLTPDLGIPIRNSTWNFTTPQFGGYQPEAGLSLGLAFLSDIQVFMFLEAVQGDRRAHIMQAPKITVYNGQTATMGGLMVRPQVTGLIPSVLPNGQGFMSPNMSQIPFGLTMTVLPVVSPDRRFIRLNVTPQLSQGVQDPAGAIVIAVPSPAQGFFDGGLPQPPLPNAPLSVTFQPATANVLVANTTVNVPDGGTVLLGGFKFLAEERTEYGPPVLSKIPYLSRLFRNVGWSRDGSTLIYLVTARVIMIEEEENIFLGNVAPIPGR